MNPRNSVKHPALVSSPNRALSWYLGAVLRLNSHPVRSEGPAVSFDLATQTNAPSSTNDAKIGGPNISIPYFAINSFITSGTFLSIGTFRISSKNFSNPPGWHIRINLASELVVFAHTCGMPRGSQMHPPGGNAPNRRPCGLDHLHHHLRVLALA
jgi:hypothetical protein